MDVVQANGDEEWSEVVGRSFYPLIITKSIDSFNASIRQVELQRGVRVAEVVSDANTLKRTTRLVREAPSDDVLLLIQLHGHAFVHQQDRLVELTSGKATICDPIVEYDVGMLDRSHQLVMTMPRDVVRNLAAPVAETRARVLTPKITSLRALTALIEETLSEDATLDIHESDALAGVMIDLTRSMLARATGSVTLSRSRESLLIVARQYIRDNAGLPGLDAEHVALAIGITPGRLATLFRPEGTPAHIIRRERLRIARERLTDPRYAHLAVSEIAAMSGFVDPTTFTRAFRREYSDRPSDLRGVTIE